MGERDDRGGAEPQPEPQERADARDLDEELLEEGGRPPRLDALDVGDPGAPARSLGAADRPQLATPYEGGAGGSGARVAEQRQRGERIDEDEDAPPRGGPAPGKPGR